MRGWSRHREEAPELLLGIPVRGDIAAAPVDKVLKTSNCSMLDESRVTHETTTSSGDPLRDDVTALHRETSKFALLSSQIILQLIGEYNVRTIHKYNSR